jgi:DNA-binding beta-propeller fold protein YncE
MEMLKRIVCISCIIFLAGIASAQTLIPRIVFRDHPQSHNMHLASDGRFLYTCNGGKAELGQIGKFNTDGNKIGSYKIGLDMRSVMYNPSDKKLYVYAYDKKLYKINNLSTGDYAVAYDFPDRSEQSAPAMSPNGKFLYFMEYGELFIYALKTGTLKTTLSGLNTADNTSDGGTAIAVDRKHIYSWNAGIQTVYIFDLKGVYQKSVKLNQGNYGFSLSFANDLLWVAKDGDYDDGIWYGYVVD